MIELHCFDLDGTLTRNHQPLPGRLRKLARLRTPTVILTNQAHNPGRLEHVQTCLKALNWRGFVLIAETQRESKPNGFLLDQALRLHPGTTPSHCLMVGNSTQDRQEARRQGCRYMPANEFFGR